MADNQKIKKVAVSAVKKGGDILRQLFLREIKYHLKGENDIVGEADYKSEKVMIDTIKRSFPTHSILSEEKGLVLGQADYQWFIDPLDGTVNYSKGIDIFTISLAVAYKKQIILGIVYRPSTDELFLAEKGKGAFLNGQRIFVSSEKKLIKTLVATEGSSKAEVSQKIYFILTNLLDSVYINQTRSFGSSAWCLAQVACGKLDLYYKMKPDYWDHAAGALLIQEAGGLVTDFLGGSYTLDSLDVAVSNKKIHREFLKKLKKILK